MFISAKFFPRTFLLLRAEGLRTPDRKEGVGRGCPKPFGQICNSPSFLDLKEADYRNPIERGRGVQTLDVGSKTRSARRSLITDTWNRVMSTFLLTNIRLGQSLFFLFGHSRITMYSNLLCSILVNHHSRISEAKYKNPFFERVRALSSCSTVQEER